MKRKRFLSLVDLGSDCVEDYIQSGVLINLWTIHHSRNRWDQWVIVTHEDYEQIGEAGRLKKREPS